MLEGPVLGLVDLPSALYGVVCVFLAAIVRGYSGFGFSMLAVISLSLLLPPAQIVPRKATTQSMPSHSLIATRSPGTRPRERHTAAARIASRFIAIQTDHTAALAAQPIAAT